MRDVVLLTSILCGFLDGVNQSYVFGLGIVILLSQNLMSKCKLAISQGTNFAVELLAMWCAMTSLWK